jgi:peptidoglycan/LPS O-acetylase OafA/YrhL
MRQQGTRTVIGTPAEQNAPLAPKERDSGGFRLGYRPALDGLRGLSILAVMAIHSGWNAFRNTSEEHLPRLLRMLGITNNLPLCRGGWVGVDVFFVLSSFLITIRLVEEWQRHSTINFKNFYLRRVLRLVPAVLVMLAAVYLFARFCLPPEYLGPTRKGIISVLLYYSNMRIIEVQPPFDLLLHTWSLSIEEQFYILWPVALWLLLWSGLRRRTIAAILLVAVVAATCLRVAAWEWPRWKGTPLALMSLPTRLDTLLFGALTGLLACWGRLPRSRRPRAVLHALAFGSLLYLGWVCLNLGTAAPRYFYVDALLIAVAAGVVLASLVSAPPLLYRWFFEFPPLVWLGRISYGLYLWHFPVAVGIGGMLTFSTWFMSWQIPGWVVTYPLSLLIATVSFYLLEQPILRLKHHLEGKPTTTARPSKRAA